MTLPPGTRVHINHTAPPDYRGAHGTVEAHEQLGIFDTAVHLDDGRVAAFFTSELDGAQDGAA